MELAIGILIGIAISALIVATIAYFRTPIAHALQRLPASITSTTTTVGATTTNATKGFIIEPESEADEARAEIIERNNKRGIDTPLTDLDYEDPQN